MLVRSQFGANGSPGEQVPGRRTFYKYLSKVYDRVNPFVWNEAMRDEALSMVDIGADDRVLDVGCGTGFGTEGLLEHTEHVYGLDQSRHQLQQAWKKLGKHDPVAFHFGDAERLPFKDGSFDVVWSSAPSSTGRTRWPVCGNSGAS